MKKTLMIFFVLTSLGSFGQSPVDTTSIEMTTALAFIQAMNNPDIEAMRAFTLNYRTDKALARTPIEKRIKGYQDFKEKMGLLKIGSIDKYEPGSIKLYVYATENDTWFKMGFKLDNGKLESLSMMPSKDPNKSGKKLDLSQQLQEIVDDRIAPGIAMVTIKDGQISIADVAGVRNSSTNETVKINDPFHLGSISKSFTASLVGRLIDDGKIEMSTELGDIFSFEIHEQYQSVTIRDVMSHEGGFPGYLTDQDEAEESRLLSLPGSSREQRFAFAKEVLFQEPSFKPKEGMNYSNAGYSILAAVCELIADKSWEEQLNEVIFKPLKMKSAGLGWPSDANPSFPHGHYENGQAQNNQDYFIGAYLDPSGDIHCSMKDLAKYAVAHLNGLNGKDGFISANAIKLIHDFKEGNNYAGGWMREENGDTTIYFHPGTAGTFFSYIALNPSNNSAYVIAANSGNQALFGIFREIIKL